MKAHDLSERRFGRLVAREMIRKNGRTHWLCQCDCGNEKAVSTSDLLSDKVKSCGCLRKEVAKARMTTHGCSNDRLYNIWCHMKDRCMNPNNRKFYCYGARGISVCTEWLDFSVFKKWATESGYNDDLTIERIDVNGNYEPSNCTFIPQPDQNKNKQNTVWVDLDSSRFCEEEAGRLIGIRGGTIRARRRRGLDISTAVTMPLKKSRPIEQRSLSGELVKTWASMKEASVALKINLPSIWKCCNGKLRKTHGYCWNYSEGE